MERGRALMGRIRASLTADEGEELEEDLLGEYSDSCSLSPSQRIYAFAACLASGLACIFLSLIVFLKPIKFGILFTFGNILIVGSTVLLFGVKKQIRLVAEPSRIYAAIFYIGSIFLSLTCAIIIHSKILTMIAILGEICAFIWYSLSYVPFARRILSDLLSL